MTAEIKVILAPRSIRILNFVIFIVLALTAVFIAVYPPFRLLQTVLGGAVALVAVVASIRVFRAGYVLTPTALKVRGLIATQTIPRSEIAAFPTAGVVERRDHWGGTIPVSTVTFREDRLGSEERKVALTELRSWLADTHGMRAGPDLPDSLAASE